VEPEPKTVRLRMRNVALAIVGALLVAVAVPLLVLWSLSPGTTAPFVNARGNTLSGSIAEVTDVRLGGLPQFVLIRGRDTANPVLLLLHGGPGDPQAPQSGYYNTPPSKIISSSSIETSGEQGVPIWIRSLKRR